MEREGLLRGNDDPLFPATRIALGATRQVEASGLDRTHWSSASPIRKIFREAFVRAGLNPPKGSRSGARTWGMNRC